MWCKTDGEKEDRGPNGDVGIEGYCRSDMAKARRQGGPRKIWKMQVERESKRVGLEREDALN